MNVHIKHKDGDHMKGPELFVSKMDNSMFTGICEKEFVFSISSDKSAVLCQEWWLSLTKLHFLS